MTVPPIRLNLLGPFEAVVPGGELHFQRKSQAVLSVLALSQGAKQSRASICRMFWADADQSSAMHNLRQMLHYMRSRSAQMRQVVTADTQCVRLEPRSMHTDVAEFERLASSHDHEALKQAIKLVRGDFLEGMDLSCDEFESWLRMERGRLRDMALNVRGQLDTLAAEKRRTGDTIVINRRIPRSDPFVANSGMRFTALPQMIIAPLAVTYASSVQAEPAHRFWRAAKQFISEYGQVELHNSPPLSRLLADRSWFHQQLHPGSVAGLLEIRACSFARLTWIETALYDISADTPRWRDIRNIDSSNALSEAEAVAIALMQRLPDLAKPEQSVSLPPGTQQNFRLDAHTSAIRALFSFKLVGIGNAIRHLERLVASQPEISHAWAWLGYSRLQEGWYGSLQQRLDSVEAAACAAETALSRKPDELLARIVLGRALVMLGAHQEGRIELAAALQSAPRSALANFALGQALVYAGHFAVAIPLLRSAIELEPNHPHLWTFEHVLAWALMEIGQPDEARYMAACAAGRSNATHWADLTLMAASARQGGGRLDRVYLATLLKRRPDYNFALAKADMDVFVHPEVCSSYLERLTTAGLP